MKLDVDLGKACYEGYYAWLKTAPDVPWVRVTGAQKLAWHRAAWAAIEAWDAHIQTQATLAMSNTVHGGPANSP